ncbi:hypothetical protein AMS68_004528 [Peltaster fructicola]|uniref:Uncharacterized protein n=1 Tax=Peltaster fructicola TaxID=286661 RepID=A0A6H0XWH2_9PEZI|nr:hypothetical protein AMS68_004528 [Peltaster fructicola]
MYQSLLLIPLALLASTTRAGETSPGSAVIINACSYEIYIDVRNLDGESTSVTISSTGYWSQQWTSLDSQHGWTFAMANVPNSNAPLEFEYTRTLPGSQTASDTVFWDLNCDLGDPWQGDWKLSDPNDASIQQACSQSPEDDNAVQMCSPSDTVSLTLCASQA